METEVKSAFSTCDLVGIISYPALLEHTQNTYIN